MVQNNEHQFQMNAAEAKQRATEQGKRSAEAEIKTLNHRFKQAESDQKVVSKRAD